jgi:hypothetical protein
VTGIPEEEALLRPVGISQLLLVHGSASRRPSCAARSDLSLLNEPSHWSSGCFATPILVAPPCPPSCRA